MLVSEYLPVLQRFDLWGHACLTMLRRLLLLAVRWSKTVILHPHPFRSQQYSDT
ncbi:hypothetical protein SOHN41_00795 [Shewanella sp. HN-41]|nr:hypothetical protein SOHN41_00795 [Shewanella sp. HN-41]